MPQDSCHVFDAQPGALAELMSEQGGVAAWGPEDLAAIFRHQMTAPVQFDLAMLDPCMADRVRLAARAHGLLLQSFGDLFRHAHPPLKLLEMVKDFAKRSATSAAGPLPAELCTLLYFMAIAAALVRHRRRITRLAPLALERGLAWAAGRKWIDEHTRRLLDEALRTLTPAQEERS